MSRISHKIYLFLLLIPLVSCSKPDVTEVKPKYPMCIAGMVETSPGIGTIDIYSDTEFSPKIQSIPEVSIDLELELPTC